VVNIWVGNVFPSSTASPIRWSVVELPRPSLDVPFPLPTSTRTEVIPIILTIDLLIIDTHGVCPRRIIVSIMKGVIMWTPSGRTSSLRASKTVPPHLRWYVSLVWIRFALIILLATGAIVTHIDFIGSLPLLVVIA
jgi:hypothetical protein